MKKVMEMAREAGFLQEHILHSKALEQFADLIRADEREALAKIAEQTVWAGKEFAEAIRERGNK
jgi:hypothetical protein